MERIVGKQKDTTMMKKDRVFGFTLIEILIVITIIGILAALSLSALAAAQRRSRDSRRKNDLNLISQGLDLYYGTNRLYPGQQNAGDACDMKSDTATDPWIPGLDGFVPSNSTLYKLPKDPKQPTDPSAKYYYEYKCAPTDYPNKGYKLTAVLEGNDPDADPTTHIYTIAR